MLTLTIFLPLAGALALYVTPPRSWRAVALATSGVVLVLAAVVMAGVLAGTGGFRFETRVPWIPSLGASYHLAVDGLSAPLITLSALLIFLVLLFSRTVDRYPREYAALFLLLETGIIGTFATLDLLLFYLFWEIALVPMYFIIGIWGKERRIEAALKFFLYTRAGSLALLLSILALYLRVEPRTFDLPTIVAAQPLAAASVTASWVLLGFFIAFAIKLPVVPLHSWLPAAHTEAPTGGSVILAGLLLKLGGYGFVRIALPTIPGAMTQWAWPLAILGALSAIYGTAVAMGQRDLKRLVAYSSINEMGYVLVAIAVAGAAWVSAADRGTAVAGATYLMIAHGLSTGALFFLVGMLEERTHEREIASFGGLWAAMPRYGTLLALITFAALGLPGLAVFVAELQILFATLGPFPWVAVLVLIAIVLTTAMFLWMLQRVLMGALPERWRDVRDLVPRETAVLGTLAALLVLLGLWPGPLTHAIELGARWSVGLMLGAAP